MSYILEFDPVALAEVECVVGDYEARVPGSGVRFRVAVEAVCSEIEQNPLRWRERAGGYRRVNLRDYPFYLPFVIRDEVIRIMAVAHASRNPDYWKHRWP